MPPQTTQHRCCARAPLALAAPLSDSRIADYSPDGRKIAFQSNRSGNLEVWTCDADGSNCQHLTSFNGPQCGNPRWSPDSKWLALDSRSEGQPEVYVMAADGGQPRRMTIHPADDAVPSWSADGQRAFLRPTGAVKSSSGKCRKTAARRSGSRGPVVCGRAHQRIASTPTTERPHPRRWAYSGCQLTAVTRRRVCQPPRTLR